MDDKNNEIIDFSNQPLGLMAQEGAKIEDNMEKEYRLNEASRNNAGTQDNPFAEISFNNEKKVDDGRVFVSENKEEVTPQPVEVPNAPVEQPVQENPLPQPAPEVPLPEAVVVEEAPSAPPTEEERKQQLMNELTGGGGEVIKNNVEQQPPSWGIFVFLILVGIVGAAIFLFKSGKLDEMLGEPKEENTQEVQKETQQPSTSEESPKMEDVKVEEIKNYYVTETYFIAANLTITTKASGVIDLENMTGKFVAIANVSGTTSHNVEEYCDYNKHVCYIQDFKDKNKWTKEKNEVQYNNPDEIFDYLMTLGKPDNTNNGVSKMEVSGEVFFKLAKPNEYIDVKKLKKSKINIEYTIENSRLKKVKYDMSNAVPEFKQFLLVQEFTKINENESVTIPEDVVKKAK